jgi:hypothetical protein
MLRYAEDLAFVLPDQLLKGSRITLPCALYKSYVGVDLFRTCGLDGRHHLKGAANQC